MASSRFATVLLWPVELRRSEVGRQYLFVFTFIVRWHALFYLRLYKHTHIGILLVSSYLTLNFIPPGRAGGASGARNLDPRQKPADDILENLCWFKARQIRWSGVSASCFKGSACSPEIPGKLVNVLKTDICYHNKTGRFLTVSLGRWKRQEWRHLIVIL